MLIVAGGHTVDYGTQGIFFFKLNFHYSEKKNHYWENCILMHVDFLNNYEKFRRVGSHVTVVWGYQSSFVLPNKRAIKCISSGC